MNFYEELGVPPEAPVEEIRQAYKALARLLHPDNQPNPVLKAHAERQMQRLNGMLATLTDPLERARYDDNLKPPAQEAAVFRMAPIPRRLKTPRWSDFVRRQVFWILIGMIVLASIVWLFLDTDRNQFTSASHIITGESPPPVPEAKGVTLADPPGRSPASRSSSIRSSTRHGSPFVGSWIYLPPVEETPSPDRHPPDSIQFVVTEQGSNLVGQYAAQYRSAQVTFFVNGRSPGGSSGTFAWSSTEGTRGQVELSLLTPDLLGVTWWTTPAADSGAYGSGTALLSRLH